MTITRLVPELFAGEGWPSRRAKRPTVTPSLRRLQRPNLASLPAYRIAGDQLTMGPSLGNAACWITTKGNGYLERLFSVAAGARVLGATQLLYVDCDFNLPPPEGSRHAEQSQGLPLERSLGTTIIHPAYQQRSFALSGDLLVRETLFVPKLEMADRRTPDDPCGAVMIVRLRNASRRRRTIRIVMSSRLRGETQGPLAGHAQRGTISAWNESHPSWVRVIGASRAPHKSGITSRQAFSYAAGRFALPTKDDKVAAELTGWLCVDMQLEPLHTDEIAMFVAFSVAGEAAARRELRRLRPYRPLLQETSKTYSCFASCAHVMTPDALVNDAVLWSKINMARTMHRYRSVGWSFTNEPGVSSNIVARDVAWFVYGCDWLLPEFSRSMLRAFARVQERSGKVPEYIDTQTGKTEDYGLNINDDTPLFVLGAVHHAQVTGDAAFAREIWPAVDRAAKYILRQRDKRGLVVCTATGTGARGIAGWRNIIANYALSGAVTEINSECYAALRGAADLARMLRKRRAAQGYAAAAARLRSAINRRMIDPVTGLYYLSIDLDGNVRDDVTADLLFPVIFGVADEKVATEIVRRLTRPDFWTPNGIRTVSRDSPDFHPNHFVGLMGGVWPGVAFWYAFAAARFDSDAMAQALHNGYASYLRDPKQNTTVPGQYSEWFDGESLVNRGMRLSPWEPPRVLWAAVEGLCRFSPRDGPEPSRVLIPEFWRWIGVRNITYRGKKLTWFAVRTREGICVHGVGLDESEHRVSAYDEDVTPTIGLEAPNIEALALRRGDRTLVALGNTSRYTESAAFRFVGDRGDERFFRATVFDSEHQSWEYLSKLSARDARAFSVRIAGRGYALVRFDPVDE